jgi:hypothetical protein
MGQPVDLSFSVARLKASIARLADGTIFAASRGPRSGPYGDWSVMPLSPTKHALADEGSYFVVTNPTPGTAVAYALQTTFSDTADGLFVIQNANPAGGPNVWLDYLKLILAGTAPTATQSMEFTVRTDSNSMVPTANSVQIAGGAGAQTIFSTNQPDPTSPAVNMWAYNAGAMTVPATSASGRRVARAHIATGLGIAGDEYELQFGAPDRGAGNTGMTAVRASSPARVVGHCAPVVLQPQQWAVVNMWWLTAATTAPSFEYEWGLVVR